MAVKAKKRAGAGKTVSDGGGGPHYSRKRGGNHYCIMHDRSRYDHAPSHPYNAGTEHVGFSPTGQTLRAPGSRTGEG